MLILSYLVQLYFHDYYRIKGPSTSNSRSKKKTIEYQVNQCFLVLISDDWSTPQAKRFSFFPPKISVNSGWNVQKFAQSRSKLPEKLNFRWRCSFFPAFFGSSGSRVSHLLFPLFLVEKKIMLHYELEPDEKCQMKNYVLLS